MVSTDTELIRRHLEGDEQASQTLISKYQDMVYNLAWRMLGNGEEARDAAQDIFLMALDSLPKFRGESAFSTWLYRIAVHGCIARSKRRKRRLATEVSVDNQNLQTQYHADNDPSSLEQVERKEQAAQLHQAIAELPEMYRMVIALHYFQELAQDEISQMLSIPTGTVKVRLFRARNLLQRKLRTRNPCCPLRGCILIVASRQLLHLFGSCWFQTELLSCDKAVFVLIPSGEILRSSGKFLTRNPSVLVLI
jgi:RNA polymerase sigma-70 factor (ECF subfamily)